MIRSSSSMSRFETHLGYIIDNSIHLECHMYGLNEVHTFSQKENIYRDFIGTERNSIPQHTRIPSHL